MPRPIARSHPFAILATEPQRALTRVGRTCQAESKISHAAKSDMRYGWSRYPLTATTAQRVSTGSSIPGRTKYEPPFKVWPMPGFAGLMVHTSVRRLIKPRVHIALGGGPLPPVADYVHQPETVGQESPQRWGSHSAERTVILVQEPALPGVSHQLIVWNGLVTPRVGRRAPGAGSILPHSHSSSVSKRHSAHRAYAVESGYATRTTGE